MKNFYSCLSHYKRSSANRFLKGFQAFLPFFVLVGVLFIVAVVDSQVLSFQFLPAWDDNSNITENFFYAPLRWESLFSFWKQPYNQLYIPVAYTFWAALVALSHAIGGSLISTGPLFPVFFHGANFCLHLATVALVFFLLQKIIRLSPFRFSSRVAIVMASAFGALLFGLHPLQAEAVAWISCLRDLLGAFFSLSALLLFLFWTEQKKRRIFFIGATFFFLLALGSKPGSVVFPAMACVLFFFAAPVVERFELFFLQEKWKEDRFFIGGLLLWFLIAGVTVLITQHVQIEAASAAVLVPIWVRTLVASDALAFYLSKLFWPYHLCADYGRSPDLILEDGQLWWTWVLPLGMLLLLSCKRQFKIFLWPYVLFITALLPVLGLVPFNFQLISTVSDRYVYLAMLAPALAVAFIALQWPCQKTRAMLVVLLCCCAFMTWKQLAVWKDGESLFSNVLKINSSSWKAHHNYGSILASRGKYKEALVQFQEASQERPSDADMHNDFGVLYLSMQQPLDARRELLRSLQLRMHPIVVRNLARSYLMLQEPKGARDAFILASELAPQDAPTLMELAWFLATYSDVSFRDGKKAVALSEKIILETGAREPRFLLVFAASLAEVGRFKDAVVVAQQAASLLEQTGNTTRALWIRKEVIPVLERGEALHCQTGVLELF